jgi:hypothetical protein
MRRECCGSNSWDAYSSIQNMKGIKWQGQRQIQTPILGKSLLDKMQYNALKYLSLSGGQEVFPALTKIHL